MRKVNEFFVAVQKVFLPIREVHNHREFIQFRNIARLKIFFHIAVLQTTESPHKKNLAVYLGGRVQCEGQVLVLIFFLQLVVWDQFGPQPETVNNPLVNLTCE